MTTTEINKQKENYDTDDTYLSKTTSFSAIDIIDILQMLNIDLSNMIKKSLKIPNGLSDSVNRKRRDNTIAQKKKKQEDKQ